MPIKTISIVNNCSTPVYTKYEITSNYEEPSNLWGPSRYARNTLRSVPTFSPLNDVQRSRQPGQMSDGGLCRGGDTRSMPNCASPPTSK